MKIKKLNGYRSFKRISSFISYNQLEIIIIAIGQAHWLKNSDIKKNTIIIDVGINHLPKGGVTGDVDENSVKNQAAFLTPVPGGIGPVTVAMLLQNTVTLARQHS